MQIFVPSVEQETFTLEKKNSQNCDKPKFA